VEIEMLSYISIGIDGGLSGAIVIIDQRFSVLSWWDMPTISSTKKTTPRKGPNAGKTKTSIKRNFDLRSIFTSLRDTLNVIRSDPDQLQQPMVFFEKAHAMPQQGVSSTFKTGQGFGLMEMALVALDVPYQIIDANAWTKEMHKGVTGGEPKAKSLLLASRLFPALPLKTPRGTKLTMDGRADAALIAYYGLVHVLKAQSPEATREKP
jgi:hypothetical protein